MSGRGLSYGKHSVSVRSAMMNARLHDARQTISIGSVRGVLQKPALASGSSTGLSGSASTTRYRTSRSHQEPRPAARG
jgi:hypothetical protein